jgi:beta-mannosidase
MTSVVALDQGWRLRGFLGDDWQLHRAQLHARDVGGRWVPARVPGSVLADLLAAGEVPDPRVERRSLLSEWVPQRTWVYQTTLRTGGLADGERAFLEFDGVDHSATVHLDGERVAAHEGTFVPFVTEVTGRLGAGEHTLAVVVDPAPVSEPQVGHTEAVTVHKGRMGYGWDFCPRLVHQGLWGPARLRITGAVRLADVWARPAAGRLTVTVTADGDVAGATAECVLRDADGAAVAESVVPLTGAVTEIALGVPSPRRWRPNGFGEPYLYTLEAAVRDGHGRTSDERRVRVGFRDVGFVREPGGPASALPYRLTVGGEPVDILGWNWVPADAMYGAVGEDRVRHLLTLAREAGVTMLRVWGGGLIESETFYDLCDEYGILVWQEFAQSSSGMSSVPSTDPAFVAKMRAEATRIVPARRNHPSLAIWCGGNELQDAGGVPLTDAGSPVLAALHDVVARLDPDRQWLPTSPSGPVFGNTLDSVRTAPEQHDVHGPWEHQGLDDHYRLYDEGRGLLLSEFGVEGMSNLRAIASVVPGARLPTHGDPVWDHLGRWWNNEPLVRAAFDDAIGDLAAMSRASQFLQADGLRYAVEANRRRPESCGVLPWQLNESFPNGWCTAAVDYFGEPKAAYHYVRRAYRPPLVCAVLPAPRVAGEEFTATVWAGPGEVTARVLRLDGTEVASAGWGSEAEEPAAEGGARGEGGGPRPLGEISCATAALAGAPFLLDLALRAGGRTHRNRYLLTAGTGFGALLALSPARLAVRLTASGDEWTLRLRHEDGPAAPFVRLLDGRPADRPGWARWDDNAVDLLPGEEVVLRCRWDGVPPAERRVLLDGWNVPARVLTEEPTCRPRN